MKIISVLVIDDVYSGMSLKVWRDVYRELKKQLGTNEVYYTHKRGKVEKYGRGWIVGVLEKD